MWRGGIGLMGTWAGVGGNISRWNSVYTLVLTHEHVLPSEKTKVKKD